jgi:carbon storage regulator
MLIISRKKDQKIIVADDIEITILEVGRNRVRFGIKAPKHIPIHTRLKTSPVPEVTSQTIEVTEAAKEPPAIQQLPAAVGMSKLR